MLVNEKLNRCGYNVDKKLMDIWEVELDLVTKFKVFCEKHNIKYYVWGGTLLGAVRHKGFIPWDDDFDFVVTRENYDKIIRYANEFEYPYFLQYALSDREYYLDYIRLRNSETTGIVKWNNSPNYNNGIYIDIYVIDGVPSNEIQFKFYYLKQKFYKGIFKSYHIHDNESVPKKLILKIIHILFGRKPYEYWFECYNTFISSYTLTSDKLALMTHGEMTAKKYFCYKSDLKNIINIPFENIIVPAPQQYDSILTNMYGDYMKLPSAEERGKWHNELIIFDPYKAYKEYFKENI